MTRAKSVEVVETVESPVVPIPVDVDELALWNSEADASDALFDDPELVRESSQLLGVPFRIHAVTYRPKRNDSYERDWISAEIVIAPGPVVNQAIQRRRVPNVESLEGLSVLPNSKIVVNDGSTGFRRQITQLLHEKGVIDVGGDPSMGGKRFDREASDWLECEQVELFTDEDGTVRSVPTIKTWANGRPLAIFARHGFRASASPDYPETPIYYLS